LTGRVSSFINVAGRKVQPEEVESVLRQMPGVADVRVLGASDAVRGEQIVACLVPDNGPITALAVRRSQHPVSQATWSIGEELLRAGAAEPDAASSAAAPIGSARSGRR